MRGRIWPLDDAMQRDFIERRFADGRLVCPFVNSRRALELAGCADGLKVSGWWGARAEKKQEGENVESDASSNLHGGNPLHNFTSPHKAAVRPLLLGMNCSALRRQQSSATSTL